MKIENDPYPGYDNLLDKSAISWNPDANMWFVLGRDEVLKVGPNIKKFSVRKGYREKGEVIRAKLAGTPLEKMSDGLLRFSDPPDWDVRRWMHEAAVPYKKFEGPESRPQTLRDQFQKIVDAQFEKVKGEKYIDAIQELCFPLPCYTTMAVLGVPLDDYEKMREWTYNGVLIMFRMTTDWDFYSDESIARAINASIELEKYFGELLAKKRKEPSDDFISRLLHYQEHSTIKVTDYQLIQITVNHLMGGLHESSIALLADGIHLLISSGQYKDLVDDPTLIQGAVEEILRFHPYAPINLRVANEDVVVAGNTIKKGQFCLINLACAQRDPRKWENARTFDIRREGDDNGDMSFGWGPHQCTGRPQIRMLANVFFETLTKTYPNLRIPEWPENAYMRLQYQPRADINLLESLPLALI
ncbi:MAG: cytochrome P450 [Flavobacteriaceae bacterium]|nr:cytochrome P450 [Flavobacteriaceae bacterium]